MATRQSEEEIPEYLGRIMSMEELDNPRLPIEGTPGDVMYREEMALYAPPPADAKGYVAVKKLDVTTQTELELQDAIRVCSGIRVKDRIVQFGHDTLPDDDDLAVPRISISTYTNREDSALLVLNMDATSFIALFLISVAVYARFPVLLFVFYLILLVLIFVYFA